MLQNYTFWRNKFLKHSPEYEKFWLRLNRPYQECKRKDLRQMLRMHGYVSLYIKLKMKGRILKFYVAGLILFSGASLPNEEQYFLLVSCVC